MYVYIYFYTQEKNNNNHDGFNSSWKHGLTHLHPLDGYGYQFDINRPTSSINHVAT